MGSHRPGHTGQLPVLRVLFPIRKEIALATSEEKTFFHELSHAAHEKIKSGLKSGQDPFQEIVAELSAQALCHLVGKQANNSFGNSYKIYRELCRESETDPTRGLFEGHVPDRKGTEPYTQRRES